MKPIDDLHDGADNHQGVICGQGSSEPLFGDRRWIEERLELIAALQRDGGGGREVAGDV
jgi:hypothetical protein